MTRWYKIFIVLQTGLLTSGCNPFADFKLNSHDLIKKGWAKNPPKDDPEPLYCYKTLGEAQCYKTPLKGQEERLQASYANLPSNAPVEEIKWVDNLKESIEDAHHFLEIHGE